MCDPCSTVNVPSKMETRIPSPELRDGRTDREPYQCSAVTFRGQVSCWLMGGGKRTTGIEKNEESLVKSQ